MKASIIMPVYLGHYPTAGNNRDKKLIRAIKSAQDQDTKHEFEIIVMVDSCEQSKKVLIENRDILTEKTRVFEITYDKSNKFDATKARNAGIEIATGDVITYLDADDYLQSWHVEKILNNFTGEWIFFDAYFYNTAKKEWYVDKADIWKHGRCGTCNFAHVNNMAIKWEVNSYGRDDWHFISKLKQKAIGTYIGASGYMVCHCPGMPFKYDL